VRDHGLGVATAPDQAEHAVADREAAGAGTEGGDLACDLEARNIRGCVGWRRVGAHALQEISAVYRRRADPHADFAPRRLGSRPFDQREDVGAAGFGDRYGSHAGEHPA
jgi:hypothetical protein